LHALGVEPGTYFWQGNIACAEGAIAAGCRFYAGYPITPSSEIFEHLSSRLPEVDGICIQMEDEISSLAAVIGASWGGAKALTATSGPGFSLMQENIGLACMTETPCVVIDVQRVGPSTGQATKCAQGDIMQARWGTHGDHEIIALAPNSVQEMFNLTLKAFNLSEAYRNPVIVLADEIIAHMREKITVPRELEIIERKEIHSPPFFSSSQNHVTAMPPLGKGLNVLVTGSTHDARGLRSTSDPEIHRKLVEGIVGKIRDDAQALSDVEEYSLDDCKVGVVSYGCTSRAVYTAIQLAEGRGIKVGHIRLKTIWPFPVEPIQRLSERAESILVPEMNMKQVYFEVSRAAEGRANVVGLNKVGGGAMIYPEEIVSALTKILRGD